jgi:hypothetical protein
MIEPHRVWRECDAAGRAVDVDPVARITAGRRSIAIFSRIYAKDDHAVQSKYHLLQTTYVKIDIFYHSYRLRQGKLNGNSSRRLYYLRNRQGR